MTMTEFSKRARGSIGLIAVLVIAYYLLSVSNQDVEMHEFGGATMGTTYSVQIVGMPDANHDVQSLAGAVSQLLHRLDKVQMSTYVPESELSLINSAAPGTDIQLSAELSEVLALALEVTLLTEGAFDVTVGSLVNRWGFGPDRPQTERVPPRAEIEALMASVGSRHLQLDSESRTLRKLAEIYIDLSGIAKGYAVDKLAELLDGAGIENYFVEIGGELRIKGYKPGGLSWIPAIEKPIDDIPQVYEVLYTRGESIALAGSGDYRNYFEQDGVHYSHEIDPSTGVPINHLLAGVYVIDRSAARADALATAFMVMGLERSYGLAERMNLAVYFISRNPANDGFIDRHTPRFESYLRPD
jgi:thiamine biosynthesis lipoprotein